MHGWFSFQTNVILRNAWLDFSPLPVALYVLMLEHKRIVNQLKRSTVAMHVCAYKLYYGLQAAFICFNIKFVRIRPLVQTHTGLDSYYKKLYYFKANTIY